jgi:hypothetical protein
MHNGDGTSSSPTSSQSNETLSTAPWELLNGEHLIDDASAKTPEIFLVFNNERIKGKFYITNFRFYYKSDVMKHHEKIKNT